MAEGSSDPYSQVKQMDKNRAEPEKIRIWREEQAELLKKKGELVASIILFCVMLVIFGTFSTKSFSVFCAVVILYF